MRNERRWPVRYFEIEVKKDIFICSCRVCHVEEDLKSISRYQKAKNSNLKGNYLLLDKTIDLVLVSFINQYMKNI